MAFCNSKLEKGGSKCPLRSYRRYAAPTWNSCCLCNTAGTCARADTCEKVPASGVVRCSVVRGDALCCDATLVLPVRRDGSPQGGALERDMLTSSRLKMSCCRPAVSSAIPRHFAKRNSGEPTILPRTPLIRPPGAFVEALAVRAPCVVFSGSKVRFQNPNCWPDSRPSWSGT